MAQATAPLLDSTGAIRRVRRYPTKAVIQCLGLVGRVMILSGHSTSMDFPTGTT